MMTTNTMPSIELAESLNIAHDDLVHTIQQYHEHLDNIASMINIAHNRGGIPHLPDVYALTSHQVYFIIGLYAHRTVDVTQAICDAYFYFTIPF